jgi:hypothetical protein
MAPARGNAALQNRVALLEQQLLHAQELSTIKLAARDALLAAKDDELAALRVALGQAQQLAVSATGQAGVAKGEAASVEHAEKRARLADCGNSPLEVDGILDVVFSYVGIGDYMYTGVVSRRWYGRYTKLCHNKANEGGKKDKLGTAHENALSTAARLQLALESSLTLLALQSNNKLSQDLVKHSLEPVAVLTLARVRGLQWHRNLPNFSAFFGKLELLQWLHENRCPWDEANVCRNAARRGRIDMLIWLQQLTAPPDGLKREMLAEAGWGNKLDAVKWLRQQGASWPSSFCDLLDSKGAQVCWTVRVVRWALDSGCTWGEWQCAQLRPELYNSQWRKAQARKLFSWAHKNGCPCTCDAPAAIMA